MSGSGTSLRRDLVRSLCAIALLGLTATFTHGAPPITIAPTTNFSVGTAIDNGLFGSIYNFNALPVPAGSYSVSNILNPVNGFGTVQVGSYIANTTSGISYGIAPPGNASADSQPLTTWLKGDGAGVVYNGAPHITDVFDAGTNTGTLLQLTGYIRITPSMVGVPQTFSLGLDDGGTLTINGTTVIDNGGIHGAAVISQTTIFTVAGLYPIVLGYYDGHATEAVLTADLLGGSLVTTANGAPIQPAQLNDPNANSVQTYVATVLGANPTPTDPTFVSALGALAALGVQGDTPAYEAALRQLSPLTYASLTSQTAGTIDFITNDLDDYLAHRRTDVGTFRAGNGLDLSGLNVFNGNVDPALQDISSHLLAYNSPSGDPKTLSDSPGSFISATHESSDTQRWNIFSRGIVVLSQNLSGGGVQHNEATSGTLQFGADYQVTSHLLVGAFFGYSHADGTLDEEGSTATSNTYMPGVYASYTDGGWYGNALAAGGVSNYDVTRNIQFPGFSASANASPSGEEEYGYISGGKDFHINHWTFGPTAGLQYVHMTTDSFTENGAGMLDLDVSSHNNDSLRSRLGGRLYYAASDGNQTWRPFIDASWQHEFMENSNSLTSSFDGAGVGTFSVTAPRNSRESALISIGTDIDINQSTNVFTAYRVEAGASNFLAQSVEAGVKINF